MSVCLLFLLLVSVVYPIAVRSSHGDESGSGPLSGVRSPEPEDGHAEVPFLE